jgi:endo-1,4-beta-xylanase
MGTRIRARSGRWVTVTVSAAAIALSTAVPASAATSLAQLASAKGRYFGTALTQSNLSNGTLTNVAGAQFNMVTPGNEMKWETVEPNRGQFNFGPGDQIVNFARSHSMRIRGHNLVWHSQLAGWVNGLANNQVQAAMENHITQEVTHYRGQLYAWDVVNEPFNEDGSLRSDKFTQAMGTGYIADAVRTAHTADPNAKLYLNDFNIEGQNAKSNAMFSLAQSLLQQGVPLNGIGFESHFIVGQVPSTLQANMQRFANLGLDVAITELDDRTNTPASSSALNQQATDYANVVKACLAVSRCVGITQWGVGDADSWIPGAFPGQGAATMYDNNYQPKASYNSTVTALGGTTGGGGGGGGGTGACTATYAETLRWSNGFNGQVTITAGSAAITSWTSTVTMNNGQVITATWNGSPTWPQANLMIMRPNGNGNLGPGASTNFGFTVSVSNGNFAAPAVTCSVP